MAAKNNVRNITVRDYLGGSRVENSTLRLDLAYSYYSLYDVSVTVHFKF